MDSNFINTFEANRHIPSKIIVTLHVLEMLQCKESGDGYDVPGQELSSSEKSLMDLCNRNLVHYLSGESDFDSSPHDDDDQDPPVRAKVKKPKPSPVTPGKR